MRIGYACLNGSLRDSGLKRKRLNQAQFLEGGLKAVSDAAKHNISVLAQMVLWNEHYGIKLLRITDLFPWHDKYEFDSLPDIDIIKEDLLVFGKESISMGHRITTHPSNFCVLASEDEESVNVTIKELNQASKIFNMMGFSEDHFNKINIHVGGTYGNKISTMERFAKNFDRLNKDTKRRLTIENDDRQIGFTVEDLLYLNKLIGIPITFDLYHHRCNPGNLSVDEAAQASFSTWEKNNPIIHISSSKSALEDSTAPITAHSTFIEDNMELPVGQYDVMVEAKGLEIAALDVLNRVQNSKSWCI